MAVDALELQRQQMAEASADTERARAENVRVFTKMWLTLGPDVVLVAGSTRHDQELLEARSLAGHRWNVLLNQEEQIVQEEMALAGRPKQRPSQPGDDIIPDRTIQKWEAAWSDETRGLREQLAALKELAKNERQELQSWRVDLRRK
jgi:hypothetical protein